MKKYRNSKTSGPPGVFEFKVSSGTSYRRMLTSFEDDTSLISIVQERLSNPQAGIKVSLDDL